jgi:hypothetical protein
LIGRSTEAFRGEQLMAIRELTDAFNSLARDIRNKG